MLALRIDNTDVIIQDLGPGKGKIILSNDEYGYDFSNYWGAMGEDTNLIEFLYHINADYFTDKLSTCTHGEFDKKKTFSALRKYLREELRYELPWYRQLEFQKDLRNNINEWERDCYSEHNFVESWSHFFKYVVDYSLIEDHYECEEIEGALKGICEHWTFIVYKDPPENVWLRRFHTKLKKELEFYLEKEKV